MKTPNYVFLGGKRYPLRFSLYASKEITEKYGTMENALKKIKNSQKNGNQSETIGIIVDLAECMIRNGCEYCNVFGWKPSADDPVDENGKMMPLTANKIMLLCGVDGIQDLFNAVTKTIETDQNKKINTTSKKKYKKPKKR